MNKISIFLLSIFAASSGFSQSYAPPAGQPGTTAIHKDSSVFVAWATGIEVHRGYIQVSDTTKQDQGSNRASFGTDAAVLGPVTGITTSAVSLGDGGWAVLSFDTLLITNGPGWDFAVFENSFSDNFLELAFVEVSSDGEHFFRFPAHTEIPFLTQINGFGTMDCRYLNNFAGKYRAGYGTPFDLDDLPDTALLDKNAVKFVKLTDVVGSIDPQYASYDAFGNIVNDPFPTPFASSGFDLGGVGVIHAVVNETASVKTNDYLELQVYPTVVSDFVTIKADREFSYTVFSAEGKLMINGSAAAGNTILKTNEFQSGIYLLTLQSGGYIKTVRLIK